MYLAWLTYIIGICFTAGPVNLTVASVAARYRWQSILPFLVGVNLVNLIYCSIAGLSLGKVHQSYVLLPYFRIAGGLFILYLAVKIFRSAKSRMAPQKHIPSFRDGFFLNLFNVKTLLAFGVTFTQFADVSEPWFSQVLLLGTGTLFVCILSQACWMVAGSFVGSIWKRDHRFLAYFSSVMLFGVALWVFFWS